ncbi:MAG TPA: TRAP transporter small permease subunit, partial [Rhodopila sp.]|nr:TRAP transporter small permease subunit [Rhodopila sp.]
MSVAGIADRGTGLWAGFIRALLLAIEIVAAVLLAADLIVVIWSVIGRFFFDAPMVWSDDVARALLLAVTFLGAAAALAHGENAGVTFFVERLPPSWRRRVDALSSVVVLIVAASLCWNTVTLLQDTAGQTVGAGLPQELFFAPLCLAAAAMTVFAFDLLLRQAWDDAAIALAAVAVVIVAWLLLSYAFPDAIPMSALMGGAFVLALAGGVPIAFVLGLATLVFIWCGDMLPGEFFAQQMARGIDNFVLLAVPFFILVGYLMEANGMSVRLISLLQRGAGRLRGGLDVVMVL